MPPRAGRATLAERLFDELSDAIACGDLPTGSKISEPLLAKRYGVSRGPLREALHRLQERQLITRSANQGARVVEKSAQSLYELFTVREALEGMAAREAARHITEPELAALRGTIRRQVMESRHSDETQPLAKGSTDADFHALIAQASRNPMLINLLCSELYALLRLYRGPRFDQLSRRRRALLEHRRILDAIEERDPEMAELQMRRHVAASRARRAAALDSD